MSIESNMFLYKLKPNLSVFEAEDYLLASVKLKPHYRLAYILSLINAGKINLYIDPKVSYHNDNLIVDYPPQFEHLDCDLIGLQKLIDPFQADSIPKSYEHDTDYIYIRSGTKMIGNVFIDRSIKNIIYKETIDPNNTETPPKEDIEVNCISTLGYDLHGSLSNPYELVIIREELDNLIAELKQTGSKVTTRERALQEENEQLSSQISELKETLDEISKNPPQSIYLAFYLAYELYKEQKPERHNQTTFIEELLLNGNDRIHGVSDTNLEKMLAKANKLLADARKK